MSAATNKFTKFCKVLSKSQRFEIFIIVCIILNTGLLASTHFMASEEFTLWTEALNTGFVCIFVFEATVKIVALRKEYFLDSWNVFDFVIIVMALALLLPTSLGYFKEY